MAGVSSVNENSGLGAAGGDPDGLQVSNLYSALEADDLTAAGSIIYSIAERRNTKAIDPLIILLEYPDEELQSKAALALGIIGDKAAVWPLTNALKRVPDAVKVDVVTALGMFDDPGVIGAIESIPLTPEEPKLINAVRSTVYKLNHLDDPETVTAPSVPSNEPPQAIVEAPTPEIKTMADIASPPVQKRNPLIAALCSFLVPGMGQVYNGQGFAKGFMYLLGMYIGMVFLFFPGILVWMYCILDAFRTANRINEHEVSTSNSSLTSLLIYAFLADIAFPVIILLFVTALIAVLTFR